MVETLSELLENAANVAEDNSGKFQTCNFDSNMAGGVLSRTRRM